MLIKSKMGEEWWLGSAGFQEGSLVRQRLVIEGQTELQRWIEREVPFITSNVVTSIIGTTNCFVRAFRTFRWVCEMEAEERERFSSSGGQPSRINLPAQVSVSQSQV